MWLSINASACLVDLLLKKTSLSAIKALQQKQAAGVLKGNVIWCNI